MTVPTFSDVIAKACQEERRREAEQERLARVARLAHASHQETPIPAPQEVDLKEDAMNEPIAASIAAG